MDTTPLPRDRASAELTEPPEEPRVRLDREAEQIAEADASIAAGYYATADEVEAWIDSLGTNHAGRAPYPARSRPL